MDLEDPLDSDDPYSHGEFIIFPGPRLFADHSEIQRNGPRQGRLDSIVAAFCLDLHCSFNGDVMVHGDKACVVAGVIDLGRIAALCDCRLNSPDGMEQGQAKIGLSLL
ncbi:hypothetical protein bcere0022_15980 [Bacillus cereus Rock3-44]|nr:hypothetical protein bcere0022_15980 [Bacillus cereus Rock3-44]